MKINLVTSVKDHTPEYERCLRIKNDIEYLCAMDVDTIRQHPNRCTLPNSDRVAYALGVRFYDTGKSCKHGHDSLRIIKSRVLCKGGKVQAACYICNQISVKKAQKNRTLIEQKRREEENKKFTEFVNTHRERELYVRMNNYKLHMIPMKNGSPIVGLLL